MPRFLNSPYFLLIASSVIWGATVPIMKFTLSQVPVFSLVFLRVAFASLLMILIFRKSFKVEKGDIPNFIYAGLFGITLNLSLFFIGLKFSQAIFASVTIASIPIFTLLAAHVYLKEKLTTKLILASLIALFGLLVIIGKPAGTVTITRSIGIIFLLMASVCWVVYEVLAKKLLRKYSSETLVFYSMTIGAISLLPLAVLDLIQNPMWVTKVNILGIGGILYGIIFSSIIAYWIWQKGLSKLSMGEASLFYYIDPISGAIFSILLLGERLTANFVLGAVLISLAVILTEYHRKYHPLHRN